MSIIRIHSRTNFALFAFIRGFAFMKIINCKQIAQGIEDEIARRVFSVCEDVNAGHPLLRRPSLAILKVGDRADSSLYVKIKERQAKSVGIETNLYIFPDNITEDEMIGAVKFLNLDETVDGILIQLPLPENLDTDKIIDAMDPAKDVDGFHKQNLEKLSNVELAEKIVPPVYGSVAACLEDIKFDLKDKDVVVIGQSDIFTRELDNYLASFGSQVKVFKTSDDWQEATKHADLIITAVGQPKLISKENIKNGVVIIDIGISQVEGKTVGDVDAESVADVDGYLTPVPGGIGPMTVALALRNTLNSFLKKN